MSAASERYGHNGVLVTKALRSEVLFLIDRKMRGEARLEARAFVRHPRRTAPDIRRLMERLNTMADLESAASYARLGPEALQRLRTDRAQGVKLRELADKYGVSVSTAQRLCAPAEQPERGPSEEEREAFRSRRTAMTFRCQHDCAVVGGQCTGTVRIGPDETQGHCLICGVTHGRDQQLVASRPSGGAR